MFSFSNFSITGTSVPLLLCFWVPQETFSNISSAEKNGKQQPIAKQILSCHLLNISVVYSLNPSNNPTSLFEMKKLNYYYLII